MTKDWVHGVDHSPVCQILLQIVVRAVITSSQPAWTSSAGMLSTPADFPFFNDCTAASTSLRRMGWSSSVSAWGQFSTDGSPLALWLYSSQQYSVHQFSICCSSVRSRFPLFHSGQVFHKLVCPLTVVLPQIFFNLATLFSYPVFFSLFHALLDVVVHFLAFSAPSGPNLFFLSSLLLSHRSKNSAVIQGFSSDDVCQGSHWLFQSLLC